MKGHLSLGLFAALLVSCEQPKIECTTGHGGFAVRYSLVAGSKKGEGSCDTKKGEIVGLEKYNPASAESPRSQDRSRAILAIRSQALGELASTVAGVDPAKVVSLGDFASTVPDAEDVCTVPSLSPAEIDAQGKVLRYTWNNVRVRVTPAYPGTTMTADLAITEDGCSAEYHVVGLWPAVSCEAVVALPSS
jgi:hypothetical protein